jgi:uncharacterized protein YjbJ (UPF0337 family)
LGEPYIKPWSQTSRDQELSVRFTGGSVKLNKREFLMGATTDKVKGTASEAIGKAKQGIGEVAGSDKLQGEGAIQEVKGRGQQALGDANEATKDAVNKRRRGQQEPLIDAS